MPEPVILFREDLDSEDELSIALKYLNVLKYRTEVKPNSVVIGRYSVLPFYRELEKELELSESRLINSYTEYNFIANIFEWAGQYGILSDLTPMTWDNWSKLPDTSFVVKGMVNSRKQNWATHMFAETKADVPKVAARLLDDYLIREQGVVVREYIPLRKLGIGLNGLPITNEWRTFWIRNEAGNPVLLSKGFYWSGTFPELISEAYFNSKADKLILEAAHRIVDKVSFFVIDVAEKEDGEWIVVELNDGQMSGLCGCQAEELYGNLKSVGL